MATITDPYGRKAATARGLAGTEKADEESIRSCPFNHARLLAAIQLFDTLVAMTFGVAALEDDKVRGLRVTWRDRLYRLTKQGRETDVFRHSGKVVPKSLYKKRRDLLLETPDLPYEVRMGVWHADEYIPTAK